MKWNLQVKIEKGEFEYTKNSPSLQDELVRSQLQY